MASYTAVHGSKRQTKTLFPIETRIRQAITRLAESDCSVLIVGEVGVGKRSVAAQIHAESNRSRAAFIELRAADCNLEQILSALATRGTIYLSGVTDLNLALQDMLVEHYLNGKSVQARLICGTRSELPDEVKSRRMKEDFFHLISPVTFRISPLRFRKSEILSIADELLRHYAKQFDRPKPTLSRDITAFLLEHTWPGNLTELETAIKTFVAIEDQSISLAALKAAAPAVRLAGLHRSMSLKEATRAASIEVERQLISEVLVATGGNRKRAADELGISYKAFLYKLKQVESRPSSGGNGAGL